MGFRTLPSVQGFFRTLLPELLMGSVLRLGKTVRIEEEGIVHVQDHILAGVVHPMLDAQRKIGDDGQRTYATRKDHRRIVTGVAITQMPVGQIQHAAEEGHEHIVLVHLRQAVVHCLHNPFGIALPGGNGAEHRSCHGHDQSGGDPFPADVTYAEIEFIIPEIIVIQVAAHFLGGDDGGCDVEIVPRPAVCIHFGDHGHLDTLGDVQFTLHFPLPFIEFIETALAQDEGTEDQDQHGQAEKLEDADQPADLPHLSVDVFVRDQDAHGPTRTGNRRVIHFADVSPEKDGLVAGLARPHREAHFLERYAVPHHPDHFIHRLLHDQFPRGAHHDAPFPAEQDVDRVGIEMGKELRGVDQV